MRLQRGTTVAGIEPGLARKLARACMHDWVFTERVAYVVKVEVAEAEQLLGRLETEGYVTHEIQEYDGEPGLVWITTLRGSERQKATSVPSLDDHVRLARLDRVLGIQTVIAMSTAVLAFIVVADTVTDGGPGWAAVALLGLLLAVLLIVDVDRIGTFGNFAEQTRLMVKAEVARVVWPRRERTLRITGIQASVAIVATCALHSIGLIIACLPQWPQGAFWGLLATVVALPLGLALAGVAYPYLRHGDRPSAVIAVSLGVLLGVLLAALAYQVSFVTNPNSTHLWAVLLGSAWYVPLYALLALGVCGIGPLRWLAYFTIKLDRASQGIDSAVRQWLRRSP